jgi:hypothetical protein
VIPQWLQNHLGIAEEDLQPSHFQPDGKLLSTRTHPLKSLVTGQVCARCNNGWMSQLEEQARPLLVPLIDASREVVDLTEDERAILGRWTLKTAAVLNAGSNFHSNVPPNHFRALYRRGRLPPKGVKIFGQQHHGTSIFSWTQGSVWKLVADDSGPIAEYTTDYVNANSYKITLLLGKLLLLAAYWPDPSWRMIIWRGIHVPLWPIAGPIAWYGSDPLASGFNWDNSLEAQVAFHVTLGVRHDRG